MQGHGKWERALLPLAVLLSAVAVAGLECQLEPLPDQRRGFLGDPCPSDGLCFNGTLNDGGAQNLVCADDPRPDAGLTCFRRCTLGGVNPGCGECAPDERCTPDIANTGLAGTGACVPAAVEGEPCNASICASCLICARESDDGPATCRRQCDTLRQTDGGVDLSHTIPYDFCTYPERRDRGEVVQPNCCLFGQNCATTTAGDTRKDVCFGPLPGQRGGTCRGDQTCDSNAICILGDTPNNIPDICVPAGEKNQPCKENASCGPDLTCICDSPGGCRNEDNPRKPPPICRQNCSTETAACMDCDPFFDCAQVTGAAQGKGVCVPALGENQQCGGSCEQCLVCAGFEGRDGGQICRRPCRLDVDQGTPDAAAVGPHSYCSQKDPDGGPPIMLNCCPLGQVCLGFTGGGGAGCYDLN